MKAMTVLLYQNYSKMLKAITVLLERGISKISAELNELTLSYKQFMNQMGTLFNLKFETFDRHQIIEYKIHH
jgi:hypothetical protein